MARKKREQKIAESIGCEIEQLPMCCGIAELGCFNFGNPFKDGAPIVNYLRTPGPRWDGSPRPGHHAGDNVTLYIMTNSRPEMKRYIASLKKGGARVLFDYKWTAKDTKHKLRTVLFR